MKTYAAKPADIVRQWYLVDASGQTLGRLAARVARLLMGKHKALVSRNADVGDFVVIINAEKIHVTGKKMTQKLYYHYTMYPGGMRSPTMEKVMEKDPTQVIEHAVFGMIPHTKLGDAMRKKLRVYCGEKHPFGNAVKKISLEEM